MGDESRTGDFASSQTREQFLRRAGAAGIVLGAGGAYAGLASRAAGARHGRNARAAVKGEVSIRYWGQGPERVAWQKRIDYFKSRYPNVKVKQQLLEKNGYEEFPALLTQIAGGNAPDVIRVLNFQPTQLVEQGDALLPLDQLIAHDKTFTKNDFVPNVWNGGKVYLSTNGGTSWTLAGALPNNGLSTSYVSFDPVDANTVYVASVAPDAPKNHLWKSTDGGATFAAIDGTAAASNGFPFGVPVNSIVADPNASATLYAGTHLGVYRSLDGGATWARFGNGLPLVNVTDFYI